MVHKYSELDLMQARIKEVPKGWSFLPIAKAFKIRNDLRKPISDEIRSTQQGLYPYYGPTKIQDYIDTYEQDGSFALIGEDGDHFLKYKSQAMTQLVDGKCTVNNHAHIIEGTELASREWFYYYFMHRDIYSYLSRQGAGRYKLNKASLEKIYLLIPPSEEQNKIAQILSTWDQAISATEKLLKNSQEQKKALMQQLLTGKKRLLDENGVRFSGEWKSTKVKAIFKPEVLSAGNQDFPIFSVTKNGLVNQSEYFNKSVASEDTSKYRVVKTGRFVMSGLNFWMGSVDVHLMDFPVIVSPAYKVFVITNLSSPEFMKQFIRSSLFQKVLEAASVVGASVVRRNFSESIFNSYELFIPEIAEQEKIAAVLSAADQEIEGLQKKLDCLKQEKKALMQQLLTGKRRVKV
ncbi:restriction endonuclease subunit S [Acinetobacter wuhouensis]|uniref:Restriction endonuclease subunit S n=1 Tax=Acinetobacter wuhouensis TaxID=1879050 RepID=A0A3G2T6J3_9GAMM|nr:restriction endonuclease subunit S [Acinetobacter wuhouensis]AYO55950.1 restriction endonuclease subunit S [Acinetobacter wuhouensis]